MQKKEDRRFEEIDCDSDDSEGVGLEGSFRSDELYFTGADLGQRSRNRRNKDYDYPRDSSQEEEDMDETMGTTTQLALRSKEDLLVERALERIRRAQMLGKTNVKLSQRELEALERKRRKDETRRRSSQVDLYPRDRRRSSGKSSPTLREQKSQKKIKAVSPTYDDSQSSPGFAAPPGMILSSHDGPSYAPLGYYLPAASQSRRSDGVSPRSHSQQELHVSPQLSQPSKSRGQSKRLSSEGVSSMTSPVLDASTMSRRLPDDPGWLPRPRSASSNHSHATDPYQVQQYSLPLPRASPGYTHNRRIVSGPPDVHYPDVQYLGSRRVAQSNQPFAASSAPSLPRQEHLTSRLHENSEGANDSGSSDDGVRVNVMPYSRGQGVNNGYEGAVGRQRMGQR